MSILSAASIWAPGREPPKNEIIQFMEMLQGTGSNPAVVKQTKTALDAVTPASENYGGLVLNDPDPTKNGYYYRSSSAWVKGRGLPDTFASLMLGGTANAQTGTVGAGVNPASIMVYFAVVSTENTSPMTLAIAGEAPRSVVNAAGNALSAGEWTGVALFFLNSDGEYQLINDPGSAAASAANATVAQTARDQAEAFAALSGPTGVYEGTFIGDGTTVAFSMTVEPSSSAHVWVALDGVLQSTTAYSVSGTTLTFTEAPADGVEGAYRIVSIADGEEVPPDGSVTTAKLGNNAVTLPKLQDIASGSIIGRATGGSGDPEEIPSTALGRSLLNAADGPAARSLLGVGWEIIELRTIASAVAQADFDDLDPFLMLRASMVLAPAVDNDILAFRSSTNNGSSFDSGGSDYANQLWRGVDTTATLARTTTSYGRLFGGFSGNAANEAVEVDAVFKNFNKAQHLLMRSEGSSVDDAGGETLGMSRARRLSTTARNALRFYFVGGNIASGFILLMGLRG